MRGSCSLCTGWPSPGTRRPASRHDAHRPRRGVAQRGVVGFGAQVSERVGEELGGVTRRSEEHAPRAEQSRGDRALHRLRRAGVGEPRRQRARGEAVVGERHEHRVEDAGLRRGRLAAGHQQVRELGQREPAHDLGREIAAGDGDAVAIRRPDPRVQPLAVGHHRRLSARDGEVHLRPIARRVRRGGATRRGR